jgi:hypothetical protein
VPVEHHALLIGFGVAHRGHPRRHAWTLSGCSNLDGVTVNSPQPANSAPAGPVLIAVAAAVVAAVLGLAAVGGFAAVAGMAAVLIATIVLLVRWSA